MLRYAIRVVAASAFATPAVTALAIIAQLSSCKVTTDQGLLDFSELAGTAEKPGFENIPSAIGKNQRKYDWNPCNDFNEVKEKTKNCQSVALCRIDDVIGSSKQLKSTGNHRRLFGFITPQYAGYGNQSSAQFDVEDNQLVLKMTYRGQSGQRVARVTFVCNGTSSGDQVTCVNDSDENNPVFVLAGRHACFYAAPDAESIGISIGTAMCIGLLVIVVIYVAGGIAYMRVRHHARGAQLIPNVTFWAALSGYAKDGILFVKAGCRPQSLTHANI